MFRNNFVFEKESETYMKVIQKHLTMFKLIGKHLNMINFLLYMWLDPGCCIYIRKRTYMLNQNRRENFEIKLKEITYQNFYENIRIIMR